MHLVSSINDEFYCKVDLGNYEICRNCPTLSEKCEIPGRYDGCQCDNIRFTDISKLTNVHRWFLKVVICVFIWEN